MPPLKAAPTPSPFPVTPESLSAAHLTALNALYPTVVGRAFRAKNPKKDDQAIRRLVQLDGWRYEGLVEELAARGTKGLEQGEVERLVEWKM